MNGRKLVHEFPNGTKVYRQSITHYTRDGTAMAQPSLPTGIKTEERLVVEDANPCDDPIAQFAKEGLLCLGASLIERGALYRNGEPVEVTGG